MELAVDVATNGDGRTNMLDVLFSLKDTLGDFAQIFDFVLRKRITVAKLFNRFIQVLDVVEVLLSTIPWSRHFKLL